MNQIGLLYRYYLKVRGIGWLDQPIFILSSIVQQHSEIYSYIALLHFVVGFPKTMSFRSLHTN